VEDTVKILHGLKPYYEKHHNVRYTPDALRQAVELSARYIHDRKLPDKAIDVIDEVGASRMLLPQNKRKKTISVRDVENVIATMARIPPKSVSRNDKKVLANLERDLKTMVFGQDNAIDELAGAIKLARAGLRDPEKPIGNYLFSGPTGVGKTEVARQLSRSMGIDLVRFDMSEYMERHTVSRLIGAPPGYVGFEQGGLLTDSIDQQPHAVLLLDEIEKAHPDLFNILLQIMDHGKLTDNNGKSVDFRNVVLIMTTNAGAAEMAKASIGFERQEREGDDEEAIEKMFSPEFRNRLDAIVSFANLSPDVMGKVVDKFVMELEAQLSDRDVTITLTNGAREWLAKKGYSKGFGARPLARVIQEYIKKPLSEQLLFGDLSKGGTVQVKVEDKKLDFEYTKRAVPKRDEKKKRKPSGNGDSSTGDKTPELVD
jgi:ATP-dependent Clp protease ATP-binding subunit ClpA